MVLYTTVLSGVFSTGATGAMAPVILRKRLIAPAVSNHNGKILSTLGTRNIKILNTLLSNKECSLNKHDKKSDGLARKNLLMLPQARRIMGRKTSSLT